MRKLTHLFIIVLFLTGFDAYSLFAYSYEEKFEQKLPFSSNGVVSVQNKNGAIEVESWEENEVYIVAEKHVKAPGRGEAEKLMEQVQIEINRYENEINITTELPRQSDNGIFDWIFGNDVSANVQYKLYVPIETNLEVKTTNGQIEIRGVNGMHSLRTTNGKITANEIMGEVDAHTTNGSMKVSFTEVKNDGGMGFYTTNGSINVQLPGTVNCDVKATTTNGSIHTDFPLQVSGKFNAKRVRGSINGGGDLLEFRTTNGSIRINRM